MKNPDRHRVRADGVMRKRKAAAARPDIIPEPNGWGYRALGGEAGGPISAKAAEERIGRAIEAARGAN